MKKYNNLIKQSLLNLKFKDLTFETLDLKDADETFLTAKKRCEVFVEKWNEVREKGLGFYIYGESGLGKNSINCMRWQKTAKKIYPCNVLKFH